MKQKNWNRFAALALAMGMSASVLATPALAEDTTPETADAAVSAVDGGQAQAPDAVEATDAMGDASEDTVNAYTYDVKDTVINIGASQDSVTVTWYGSNPTGGLLRYGVQGGEMNTVTANVAPTSQDGWYKNYVTLTGLAATTTYEYAVSADQDAAHYQEAKTFTTKAFGDAVDYSFLLFGDPQIGSSGNNEKDTAGWLNTLAHATAKFPNINFLFSMGDQINAYYNYDQSNLAKVEAEYDAFLSAPQIANLPLATELGNHDCGYNTALYGQHFTLPNVSASYGQVSGDAYGDNPINSESNADGDYYFTYNNTLFMVLNSSCLSVAEHKAFLEETLAANPNADWTVVSFHKSIYSVASHVTEADIETLRNGLSPVLNDLGIDVVLQGHDHVYARSYIMGGDGGMTADVQKDADGKALTEITNPNGVQYLTFNSASGSKFYKITNEAFEYTAVMNQEKVPNYSVASVTADSFTVTTYRSSDDSVVDTITLNKSEAQDASAFVTRLYKVCLDRAPDADGLAYWNDKLTTGAKTAAEVVEGFMLSKEYTAKNLSNGDYVENAYTAMLGRASDESGKATWVANLNNGMSRVSILAGFTGSAEFKALCETYGIQAGTIALTEARDKNAKVTGFVARLYTTCLDRAADVAGLNDWCNKLLTNAQSAKQVAGGFVFSAEFTAKKYNNKDYITHLYRAFMGREPDAAGLNNWVAAMNAGMTRQKAFDGFADSTEFGNIVAGFGLK